MINWHTDNSVSHNIADTLKPLGIRSVHIKNFPTDSYPESVFYGIMRGTGNIMHEMKRHGKPFWYMDNGYFDAEYVDQFGLKSPHGTYRVVPNDMLEPYGGLTVDVKPITVNKNPVLLFPPSTYTACFYDTAPTDWVEQWANYLLGHGYDVRVRDKGSKVNLHEDLNAIKAANGIVLAFNSMSVMSAIERGIPTYDTHGCFRNANEFFSKGFKPRVMFAFSDVEKFYRPRQFTLKQISDGMSPLGSRRAA